jgi:hypothetical protein
MKLKHIIALLFVVAAAVFISACTNVESKNSEEVVIDRKSTGAADEVFITNSDVKGQKDVAPVSTTREGTQLDKRRLPDKSQIETIIDGFGNKTETRYFEGHPRLRLVIVRTSPKGAQEVTVYGNGATKLVNSLGDRALTASGDEIANEAQLYATRSFGAAQNFMKKRKTETQTLQPLPSSAFQKPVGPVNQTVEPARPETNMSNEKPATRQNNPEEY